MSDFDDIVGRIFTTEELEGLIERTKSAVGTTAIYEALIPTVDHLLKVYKGSPVDIAAAFERHAFEIADAFEGDANED